MNLEQLSDLASTTHERVKELQELLEQEDMSTFTQEMFEELGEYLIQLYSVFLLLIDLLDEIRSQE